MHLQSSVAALVLSFAAAVVADPFDLPSDFNRFDPPSGKIDWGPCKDYPSKQCGRFEVPLDYHNLAAGKASLAVVRYPATQEPKLGTLFLNPGGPGMYPQS
jgi:hypothetical protein